ncbi:MAG: UDP-N-acetylglucosamine 2-epimerase (non-hydrolyzing) [Desulfarculales bacterium]|jgi:UDP-N-acetylglucosamine 2-epimerase|nr:UDP-N-acetylglucosamine 2-epimerase (non-hydrolyzing) [Desulfarculales bacterium]
MNARAVLILIGTRPEAVKLAPVVHRLRQSPFLTPVVCSTGQHKEMLESALAEFDIHPDMDLAVMAPGQTLNELAGRIFLGLAAALREIVPACILVQGDTTSALVGAMSGFYAQIPVGHVEAGLRSGDMYAPYPEEFNRRAAALAATWHFAPTRRAAENLVRENVDPGQVFITGNTVVDALLSMREKIRAAPPRLPEAIEELLRKKTPYVLITGHRRENFGKGMEDICRAIASLARSHPECAFLYPVHLNPQVGSVAGQRLGGLSNVFLLPPCAYRPFLRLMDNSLFIISDSGGIQEEAPSFGKQVLVTRAATERPEGVEAGVCRLVGTDVEKIVAMAEELFITAASYGVVPNPYGDGKAAERIVSLLEERL